MGPEIGTAKIHNRKVIINSLKDYFKVKITPLFFIMHPSVRKLNQIKEYGSNIVKVVGSR